MAAPSCSCKAVRTIGLARRGERVCRAHARWVHGAGGAVGGCCESRGGPGRAGHSREACGGGSPPEQPRSRGGPGRHRRQRCQQGTAGLSQVCAPGLRSGLGGEPGGCQYLRSREAGALGACRALPVPSAWCPSSRRGRSFGSTFGSVVSGVGLPGVVGSPALWAGGH